MWKYLKKAQTEGSKVESKHHTWHAYTVHCPDPYQQAPLLGTSRPPLGKSVEYLLTQVTVQLNVPPLDRNKWQGVEIVLDTWPTITHSFFIRSYSI